MLEDSKPFDFLLMDGVSSMDERLEITLKITMLKTKPQETNDEARRWLVDQVYDIGDVDNVELLGVRGSDA